jgi:hypothetical protein
MIRIDVRAGVGSPESQRRAGRHALTGNALVEDAVEVRRPTTCASANLLLHETRLRQPGIIWWLVTWKQSAALVG